MQWRYISAIAVQRLVQGQPYVLYCWLSVSLQLRRALPVLPAPQCVVNAHDTPLQCLEYAEERDELATCGMGNKVKIWDIKRPAQVGRGEPWEQGIRH